jgi:hypothetical protein
MLPRSEALALIVAGIVCVIGIIICAVVKVTIPGILGDLALVAISGGAGASRSGTLPLPAAPVPPVPPGG